MGDVIKGPWPKRPTGVKQWHLDKKAMEKEAERMRGRMHEIHTAASVMLVEAAYCGHISDETASWMASLIDDDDTWRKRGAGATVLYDNRVDRLRLARAMVFAPMLLEGACAAVSELADDSEAKGLLLEAIDRAVPNDEDKDSRTPPDWVRAVDPVWKPAHKRGRRL